MRNSASFVTLFIVVIETAVSKPLWTTLIDNNYLYSTPEINTQPQYFTAYQNTHSPYYIYNVHTNTGGIPGYNFYYGTPIYDYRIPLSPIYPVLTPVSQPGLPPRPLLPPTSTQPSEEDDYDGIEKLDMKVDPNTETKKPENSEKDNDSIVVDAI